MKNPAASGTQEALGRREMKPERSLARNYFVSIDIIDNGGYNLPIPQKGVVMVKQNLMCMCRMCMRRPASCPLCVHKQN